jgi:SAM-dependent methyltransferase
VARLDVPGRFWRTAQADETAWLDSARHLLDLLARTAGRPDLGDVALLDVGCGTKFTKVLLEEDRPIRRYVGIDVDPALIEFLRGAVDDPRFAFHHLDAHNAMYNPGGTPLGDFTALPVGDERFDVLGLFSVFTHLAPHDYQPLLRLLRAAAEPGATLVYSIFIGPDDGPDFVDLEPDRPLQRAFYREDHARALVEGTGWRVEALHPPELPHVQHYFVCRPS